MTGRRPRWPALTLILGAAACLSPPRAPREPQWDRALLPPPLAADEQHIDTVAQGVLHRSYVVRRAPWAIHVLDIDRGACWRPVALKGAGGAPGRTRTSQLIDLAARAADAASRPAIAGGVNADFFLFAPAGLPVGAHVHDGRVVAGPAARPVFAVDSTGRAWFGELRVEGSAVSGVDSLAVVSWNRQARAGLAYFDDAFGARIDTARGSVRAVVSGRRGGRVVSVDTGGPTSIPPGGGVLVLGADAPAAVRARFAILAAARATFDVTVRLTPRHPREAVGGFPVLVRDSTEVAGLDSAGAATFAPVRHPRTLVASAAGGRRLFLITVDGRQPGYSAGMTLREAAGLALALGATDAMNLDGGGSSAMVIARRNGPRYRYDVVNHPSDPQGERAVGNALAVARGCERS
jgi:hypothetical protein